jgi:hypothetical protein
VAAWRPAVQLAEDGLIDDASGALVQRSSAISRASVEGGSRSRMHAGSGGRELRPASTDGRSAKDDRLEAGTSG